MASGYAYNPFAFKLLDYFECSKRVGCAHKKLTKCGTDILGRDYSLLEAILGSISFWIFHYCKFQIIIIITVAIYLKFNEMF